MGAELRPSKALRQNDGPCLVALIAAYQTIGRNGNFSAASRQENCRATPEAALVLSPPLLFIRAVLKGVPFPSRCFQVKHEVLHVEP